MTIFRFSAVLLSPVVISCSEPISISQCNQYAGMRYDPELLDNSYAQREENKKCIRSWAYSLASSNATTEEVSRSAVQACINSIEYGVHVSMPREAVAPVTDEEKRFMTELREFYTEEALSHVIKARAGHCEDL